MDAQILIRCGDSWFQFSKSQTGILDYNGKLDTNALPDTKGYQELASSTYFSPSWYIFLQSAVNNNPKVYVAPDIDVSDEATFSFLIHVGALLAAVDAKDSLLAGELYLRRKESFEKFAPLTQYIIEPLCAEILFSLAFGKMQNLAPESVPLIYNIAKKKLGFDSSRETLEQAFMRYFNVMILRCARPMRARATGTKSFIIAATSSAFPTGYSGITALRWRRPRLYEQLRTPQYASPRPSISPPSLYVLSAAAAYITGPSKFFAISVSGVSGPKFPRKTQSALHPELR